MCGIAGIFAYQDTAPKIDRDELLKIRDHMINRGPDGSGMWLSADQRVGLAHRRLAIIDLSDGGAQPMVDTSTGNQVVFNGEIYNYVTLRHELIGLGHQFRSNSDTEVLLKLYAEYGSAMLTKLRGMYAFALWDQRLQQLFMARDPIGIKPLYFSDDGRTFRFASQVKALLAGRQVDTRPDAAGHAGFFLWGNVPEPFTLFKGIRALPAGHYLRVSRNSHNTSVCFDSPTKRLAQVSANAATHTNQHDMLDQVAHATRRSIEAHQVADVPVGVFLSAGLDSAMLAATCAEHGEIHTITLGFHEFRSTPADEVIMAEQLARQLATKHNTTYVNSKDFHADREQLLHAMDQPSIDSVNTWFVAKAAARQGLKVALSGIGGDELFASYDSFHQVPYVASKMAALANFPKIGRSFRMASAPVFKRFTSPKYAGLLEYGNSICGAYLLRRSLYMPWELPALMDPDMAVAGLHELKTESALNAITGDIQIPRLVISALESSIYMRNQLLRDADWAGMAHSLEIRVPFADIQLLTEASAVFGHQPQIKKQQIAKLVAHQLPVEFLERRKTGFSIPVPIWISQHTKSTDRGLRGWAREVYSTYTGY